MKILITGGQGFLGRNVVEQTRLAGHEVHFSDRIASSDGSHVADLSDIQTVTKLLDEIKPEVIINCAGVVENSEKASLNVEFTSNILNAAVDSQLTYERIVILGSAAEYGIVGHKDAVSEDAPIEPSSIYGEYKAREVKLALDLKQKHSLPVVVMRPFNPIGGGMHPRLLLPNLARQLKDYMAGVSGALEISRLDAARDYIHVKDVATAIVAVAAKEPKESIYNIGLGNRTTNAEIIDIFIEVLGIKKKPLFNQTTEQPEPLVAAKADISRLKELGWQSKYSLIDAVKEVIQDGEK